MGMDADTREEFKEMLINFSRKMMFVSGETAEPSVETTTLIEDIVRQQVVEIVCSSPTMLRTTLTTAARKKHCPSDSSRRAIYLYR